ncbi:MAG: TetR/AcrR family transcriptional regulator [Actinomycetota bacterium]
MLDIDGLDIRTRRHHQVRDQILEAAWDLAEERGVAGLSLRELARRVGMRAPSLYNYFGSKDDLFDAMFLQGFLQLEEEATAWTREVADLDVEEALSVSLQRWVRFCQESVARYQLMFTQAVPGWRPSPEAYSASRRQYEAMEEALGRLGLGGRQALDLYTAVAAGLAAQQLANDPTGDRWVSLAPQAARLLAANTEGSRP